MHTVTCPKCQNVLQLPKPVSNAKIRCAGCQSVFVASSVPVASPSPVVVQPQALPTVQPETQPAAEAARQGGRQGRAAKDDRSRLYRKGAKPRNSVPMVVGSILGILGVIVLVVLLDRMSERRSKTPPGDETAQTQPKGKTSQTNGGQAVAGGGPIVDPNGQPPRTGGQTTPPTGGGGGTTPPTGGGRNELKDDPMFEINYETRTSGISTKVAYGTVVNNHDYGVERVTVGFMYRNAQGVMIIFGRSDHEQCMHIPAKGSARFSLKLAKIPKDVEFKPIAYEVIREKPTVVCWMVDTANSRYTIEDNKTTLIMQGRVGNPMRTDVTDVRLFCDFIDQQGYVYSAVGGLTKGYRITPGGEEDYTVRKHDLVFPAGIMPNPIVRLVGQIE